MQLDNTTSPAPALPIGFNLLAWTAAPSEAMNPVTDRLKTIGYDGIECFIDDQPLSVYQQFGQHLDQVGLQRTCVTIIGADENPASESAAVREKALDRLKAIIDRAAALGGTLICGPFHSAFGTFSRQEPQPDEYARSADILRKAGDYAQQANILLAPEALNRFECYLCNTMTQLDYLLRLTDHPNVQAMFDTHHANLEEKKYGDAIRTIAPRLRHVHISENDRGTPGEGHIPWDDVFQSLADVGYNGWLTIEAFSRTDAAFANSIGVWRQYNDPWDIAERGIQFIRDMRAKYPTRI